MLKSSELRANVTNEQIKKLRDFMMFYLDSTDDEGKISLDKIMNNATYNMGEAAAEICGLIFQEKLKLEKFEDEYRRKRREVYEATMNTRYAWTPTTKGVEIMVEGDETLSKIKHNMEKQRLYIEFLTDCQEAIRYYPRNAQSLINIASYGKEIGQILG